MRKAGLAFQMLLASCSSAPDVAGAGKAINQFHNELNAADYRRIYADSDVGFKRATSEPDLVKFLTAVHTKLGAFQNGNQTGWRVNYNTGGNNTIVQLDSQFEKGKATETFTFVGESRSPRLFGYNIDSQTLITG